jgi:hypothetical protein
VHKHNHPVRGDNPAKFQHSTKIAYARGYPKALTVKNQQPACSEGGGKPMEEG